MVRIYEVNFFGLVIMCTHSDILQVNVFAKVGKGCICDETGIQPSNEFAFLW